MLLSIDMTDETENIFDFLSEREAKYSDKAMRTLESVLWAKKLTETIKSRGGLTSENMTYLFELRFAYALHLAGIAAEYEVTGEGKSTLDFRFSCNGQTWQVELMRLLETQATRDATVNFIDKGTSQLFQRHLSSEAKDKRQSEEGETLKAVQRICQKCEKGGQAYKFPAPGKKLNVLLVDFRTFLHGGDVQDRVHVGLGGEYVSHDVYRRCWEGQSISGVFNERTRVNGAEYIRQRVHFLGFVAEEKYGNGEFAKATQFIANPFLFRDGKQARTAMQNWPLQPATLINSA